MSFTRIRTMMIAFVIVVLLALSVFGVGAQTDAENPFTPVELIEIADMLRAATSDADSGSYSYGIVLNHLSPFWTAAAIGEQRAASEIGVPVVFMAPPVSGDIASQQSLVETLVSGNYSGIAVSAIDPDSLVSLINNGINEGTNVIMIDSDSADSDRPLFIALDNFQGGFLAGQAMVDALGEECGQVVGFVGFLTAQNTVDRIAGIEAAFEGTDCYLETVIGDDGEYNLAVSNSEQALVDYPDLKGVIGIYSYNGPALVQALEDGDAVGRVKLVAFDLAVETMQGLEDGIVSAAIGQRVYYYGYLPVYILHSMSVLGVDETMAMLEPYLSQDNPFLLDAGADVVTPDNLDQYREYLESIGIASQ